MRAFTQAPCSTSSVCRHQAPIAAPKRCCSAAPSSSRLVVAHQGSADTNGAYDLPVVKGPISGVGAAASKAVNAVSDAFNSATGKESSKPVDRSKGLWTRCDKCGVILYIKHLKEHHHICFGCNYHLRMSSAERVEHLIDPGTWRPLDETLSPMDPLEFADMKAYPDRVKDSQEKTGLQDAIRTGTGTLHGIPVALAVMEFGFMGGSMGSVVGEKLTRLIEYATQEGLTLLVVCTSGGARMQEGIFSLMQMAKISAALHVHQQCANLLYIAILTSPTTGGVTASFGMLGDVIIAEPQAIIGFAGRRVIEQTLAEQLPDDFQTAEYLLDKGLLDLVIPRSFMKGALYEIIDFYRQAPFKKQGRIPFGVQQGTYGLTAEEKMRRRFAEWSKASSGDATYEELVESYTTLAAANGAAGDVDVRQLVQDPNILQEAIDLARNNTIEWVEQQEALLAKEPQFTFRVREAAKV